MDHTVIIQPDGVLQFLYDDCLQLLLETGKPMIRRASHIEPTVEGDWFADLSLSGGPVFGPFALRQDAVEAERHWLAASASQEALQVRGSPFPSTQADRTTTRRPE